MGRSAIWEAAAASGGITSYIFHGEAVLLIFLLFFIVDI